MKRTDNFSKFVKQPKGSAIKEKIKQEKKKEKKERAEAIERHFAKKREERALQRGQGNASPYPSKSTDQKRGNSKAGRPSKFKGAASEGDKTSYTGKENKKGRYTSDKIKTANPGKSRNEDNSGSSKRERSAPRTKESYTTKNTRDKSTDRPHNIKQSPWQDAVNQESNIAQGKRETKSTNSEKGSKTPFESKNTKGTKPESTGDFKRTGSKSSNSTPVKTAYKNAGSGAKNTKGSKAENNATKLFDASPKDLMPLNKFIAHSGICSRRDAAILVKEEKVTVNGRVVTDPGTKVSSADTIQVGNSKVTPTKNFVYILLNKPKDFITTSDDPQGRRTVLDLVKQATPERIYPVGRLDRNTSGVLLLTNDGELAQKLSHPKHEIKKVYEVKLDRNLTKGDMDKIAEGLMLEDGLIAPDVIAYADPKDKSIIGIEIHSGRNRIVRRIFEHMKYDVRALDRVMYAGLTKKNVQRGNWRFLSEKEVRLLKFMNQSTVKSKDH